MSIHGGKNRVVLGVTGSIAAYKAAELARKFIKSGYEVRTVFSSGADQFITPMTFSAITRNTVMTSFKEEENPNIGHIELADWGDIIVVAPATADIIAKYAAGIADNPLLAVLLATRAEVLFAPAMNVNMLSNPATVKNINTLKDRGVHFADPGEGPLACGWRGRGRMAEPWDVYHQSIRALSNRDYCGKKVVVVTGPTREPMDPIRFLSNRSTGKMGVALARDAYRRGADVTVIHGPVRVKLPNGIKRIGVTTAEEMRTATITAAFPKDENLQPDIVIMAAAVSDVRPAEVSDYKVKRGQLPTNMALAHNADILAELGSERAKNGSAALLVGFAVETGEVEDLIAEVNRKLNDKKVDMIVGNFAEDAMGTDTNRVWIVDKHGRETEVATAFKNVVAEKILNRVKKL